MKKNNLNEFDLESYKKRYKSLKSLGYKEIKIFNFSFYAWYYSPNDRGWESIMENDEYMRLYDSITALDGDPHEIIDKKLTYNRTVKEFKKSKMRLMIKFDPILVNIKKYKELRENEEKK